MSKNGKPYSYTPKGVSDAILELEQELRAIQAMNRYKMIEGDVALTVFFKKTRADIGGLLETLMDCLEGFAYENDRQIKALCAVFDTKNSPELVAGETAVIDVEPL